MCFVIYIYIFKYIFCFVVARRDGEKIERGEMSVYYSHSVVPGGLDVRSYKTREIPGTVDISVTTFFTTCKIEKEKLSLCIKNENNYKQLFLI